MAQTESMDLIFLGSGVSTALPRISCILRKAAKKCRVCERAFNNPTDENCRCNVSALIRTKTSDGKIHNLMIDVGKTMRYAVLRWFPKYNVTGINAVLLTHGHADAVGGIDDLRDLQVVVHKRGRDGNTLSFDSEDIPIFLNQETFEVCKGSYPYLIPESKKDDG